MANFRLGGFPPVTPIVKNLIIINGLMFALRYVLQQKGIDLDAYLGLHYWQSPLFRWWQPITHMFMHGSLEHIFFNMFGLYMFGSILENVWTKQRFLLFYFICGLGAALCYTGVLALQYTHFQHDFMLFQQHPTYDQFVSFVNAHHLSVTGLSSETFNPQELIYETNQYYTNMINDPMVGASGAIFGILFAFGYLFPDLPLMIFFIPIPVKAKWVVTGYCLLELTEGLQNSPGDNVAHFAHLGGALFAFILLRIWNNKIRNRFY